MATKTVDLETLRKKLTPKDYKTDLWNDWCPGCGDFGITASLQQALFDLRLLPSEVVTFSGIGCSSKTPHWVNAYGVHTLHGRSLPFAQGVKLANPNLVVVNTGGDGDGLGIGVAHFVNIGRRNIDLTYIIYDNGVYGLTKGQASPTLRKGVKTKSLPKPNIQGHINPLILAWASGFTFIARGYSYEVPHTKDLIKQAIQHRGLALVSILQPCPTYNDINTKEWFGERIYKLGADYNPVVTADMPAEVVEKKVAAFTEKAFEWGDHIPIGVFYKDEGTDTFEDRIAARVPTYREAPPALRPIADEKGNPLADVTAIVDSLVVAGG